MKLTYPAVFYKDEQSGAYAVEVPDLPGCATGGNTLAEAILMGTDAASGWVLTELEEGHPAPPSSAFDAIRPGSGGFVSLLALDMDAYAEKFGVTIQSCSRINPLNTGAAAKIWLQNFMSAQKQGVKL